LFKIYGEEVGIALNKRLTGGKRELGPPVPLKEEKQHWDQRDFGSPNEKLTTRGGERVK